MLSGPTLTKGVIVMQYYNGLGILTLGPLEFTGCLNISSQKNNIVYDCKVTNPFFSDDDLGKI
jgi:hypothetical protein